MPNPGRPRCPRGIAKWLPRMHRSLTLRRVALLFVAVFELVGFLTLIIGPKRVEHVFRYGLSTVEFRAADLALQLQPNASRAPTDRQPPFATLLQLARVGDVANAESRLAVQVATSTWLG